MRNHGTGTAPLLALALLLAAGHARGADGVGLLGVGPVEGRAATTVQPPRTSLAGMVVEARVRYGELLATVRTLRATLPAAELRLPSLTTVPTGPRALELGLPAVPPCSDFDQLAEATHAAFVAIEKDVPRVSRTALLARARTAKTYGATLVVAACNAPVAGAGTSVAKLQQALLFEQARRAVAAAQRLEDALGAGARPTK